MGEKLKPCPFCGGKGQVRKHALFTYPSYRIDCERCGAGTALVSTMPCASAAQDGVKTLTDQEALALVVRKWNDRGNYPADSSPPQNKKT